MNEVESNKIREFTDLKCWQEGHRLVLMIYGLVKSFPKEEMFALSDQLRRSAVSVTANIAEGFGRHTYKEKVQFFYMAQGSLTEVKNHLLVARDIGYVKTDEFNQIFEQANSTHRLLQGIIKKTKSFVDNKKILNRES